MFIYKEVDHSIADTALKVVMKPSWYLTEEVVRLSLFSDKLNCMEKSRLVAKLL